MIKLIFEGVPGSTYSRELVLENVKNSVYFAFSDKDINNLVGPINEQQFSSGSKYLISRIVDRYGNLKLEDLAISFKDYFKIYDNLYVRMYQNDELRKSKEIISHKYMMSFGDDESDDMVEYLYLQLSLEDLK